MVQESLLHTPAPIPEPPSTSPYHAVMVPRLFTPVPVPEEAGGRERRRRKKQQPEPPAAGEEEQAVAAAEPQRPELTSADYWTAPPKSQLWRVRTLFSRSSKRAREAAAEEGGDAAADDAA